MSIGTQPYVIREVPSLMVRVVIHHNFIRIPEPVVDEVVIVRRNAEKEVAEPEAFSMPACKPPDVLPSDASAEVPMFPRMFEVKMGIVAAGFVSHPLIVRVNVRRLWMAWPVRKAVMFWMFRWMRSPAGRLNSG